MAPVRTNLDQRLTILRGSLAEYFGLVTKEYKHAIDAITAPSDVPLKKVHKIRSKVQNRAEDLTQELLLVLTLNQPLLQDLRMIAAYLRAVDAVERLARHARDVAVTLNDWAKLDKIEAPPHEITGRLVDMGKTVTDLVDLVEFALLNEAVVDQETAVHAWGAVKSHHSEIHTMILEAEKSEVGGRSGRTMLAHITNRFERSAYNLLRLAELWHHAIENEWVQYEE